MSPSVLKRGFCFFEVANFYHAFLLKIKMNGFADNGTTIDSLEQKCLCRINWLAFLKKIRGLFY